MTSRAPWRVAVVATLALTQACQAPNEVSDASRVERLTETFFTLCPIGGDAARFQQGIADLRGRQGVTVTEAGGPGSYELNWGGEVIDVAFMENPVMTLCGMRFRPAPLLTQSISTRLGREPSRDAGDGLISWAVTNDHVASIEYQNLTARGIPYRPASPAEQAIGMNIGFGDAIMLIEHKAPAAGIGLN
ncbi:MAG: hypothetical protein R3C31_12090 [Hyphomonadaceae bacterium]